MTFGALLATWFRPNTDNLALTITVLLFVGAAFLRVFPSYNAGFYYLVSGIKNPTPFDYPLATAFGRNGKLEVVTAISRREIHNVFLDSQWFYPSLDPAILKRYVQEHMKCSRVLRGFTLYRPAADP